MCVAATLPKSASPREDFAIRLTNGGYRPKGLRIRADADRRRLRLRKVCARVPLEAPELLFCSGRWT